MTIKLTKEQRHKAYKKALRMIQNQKAHVICYSLDIQFDFKLGNSNDICSSFPEFKLFKPDDYTWIWFDERSERINALQLCIEMTR